MNREIKFRAWNIVTKKMIDLKKITPLALNMDTDGLFLPFSDGLPLMQFTGMKDLNGKEIYEGDIVKWDDHSKGKYWRVAEVFYDNDEMMFSFRIIKCINCDLKKGYVFDGNFMLRGENPSKELEITGNIYENEELLKIKT
jgi:uncharacterized phage protein (TIGR01671 family)